MFPNDARPLAEAVKLLPKPRVHVSTIFRWCMTGVRGVRLRHYRAGRRMFVTPADLEEFCRALADRAVESQSEGNAEPARPNSSAPTRSDIQRERDISRAEQSLNARGVR